MLTWRFRQIPLAPEPVIKPTGRATSHSGLSRRGTSIKYRCWSALRKRSSMPASSPIPFSLQSKPKDTRVLFGSERTVFPRPVALG